MKGEDKVKEFLGIEPNSIPKDLLIELVTLADEGDFMQIHQKSYILWGRNVKTNER